MVLETSSSRRLAAREAENSTVKAWDPNGLPERFSVSSEVI